MKKLLMLLLFALFLSCSQKPEVKNVILVIGDGTGYNQQQAGSFYLYGEKDMLASQNFPMKLAMSTFSASGHGYDATLAHSDFEYLKEKPTDSAAAGTALACGVKTYNGAIGVNPDKNEIQNIMEHAEKTGRATGVVTSVPFSHATPAAFTAHDTSRNNYQAIAHDQILSACEVIIGAGHPFYDGDGQLREEANFKYISKEDLNTLQKQLPISDANADGENDGWTFVESKKDFLSLAKGETPTRVFGIPQVASTLQFGRSGADETVTPYDTPQIQSVPSLAELSRAALNVLDNDPDGFYLMIEAGAIDWTCHANNGPRMVEEVVDMENTVKAVMDWVESNSSWDETVVIVTADHETGYLLGPGSGEGSIWNPIANRGQGEMPAVEWHEGGHTNSLVPVQAKGPRLAELQAYATQKDNLVGDYLDNTDIFKYMHGLLK